MRILQVNDYAWKGGCEVLMHLMSRRLREHGLEVEILTADAIAGYRRTPLSYLDSRPARAALTARLRDFDPDVVHLHNYYHELSPGILGTLGEWRRRRDGQVFMTAHDYHLLCPNPALQFFRDGIPTMADPEAVQRWRYLLTRRWDHRGLSYAALRTLQHLWNYRMRRRRAALDVVVCPSRFMAAVLEPLDLPTVVLPNPAPPPAEVGPKPTGAVRMVFAGRVEPEKGLEPFLRTLPAGFPGTLTVIGDGGALEECRVVVQRRRIDDMVSFTGPLAHEVTLEHLAAAHVVVLPSRWYENAPFVLLEALACRTSLLVSDLGGMREIVQRSGVGYTFDPAEPATLHTALQGIVEDHEAGRLNGFDAAGFLHERGEDAYIERLVALYRGESVG